MNAAELARNKFNALFAAHDAKDTRAGAEKHKPPFEHSAKKEEKRTSSPKAH